MAIVAAKKLAEKRSVASSRVEQLEDEAESLGLVGRPQWLACSILIWDYRLDRLEELPQKAYVQPVNIQFREKLTCFIAWAKEGKGFSRRCTCLNRWSPLL